LGRAEAGRRADLLDGDPAAQQLVVGEPDPAGATGADDLQEPVAAADQIPRSVHDGHSSRGRVRIGADILRRLLG
jgi:hypothetical protein